MSHIFISYSRRDLDFAQKIVDALAANNLDTWIDWKSIPKGEDWEQEIYRGIEEADAFLFLISPDSVASQMCNKEIAHAVKNGKRILPILIREADPKIIHPEISKRNWIFCRDGQDDFKKVIEEIHTTIHTDYEWLKYHTKLQVKALDWERRKDNSRLLRGRELREADEQLTEVGSQKDPQPTYIQRYYVLASRRNEELIRRRTILGLVAGLAIMILISIYAVGQRNTAVSESNAKATALINEEKAKAIALAEQQRAEEQARIALARQLAAQSTTRLNVNNADLALLLAIEAGKVADTSEASTALRQALSHRGRLQLTISAHLNSVEKVVWNRDNSRILTVGCEQMGDYTCAESTVRISDAETGAEVVKFVGYKGAIKDAVWNADESRILVYGDDGTARVWDTKTGRELVNIPADLIWVDQAYWNTDESLILTIGLEHIARVWDAKTGENLLALAKHEGCDVHAFWNKDENRILTTNDATLRDICSTKGTTQVWDARDGQLLFQLPGDGAIWNHDGSRILTFSKDGSVQVWDAKTGTKTITLLGHTSRGVIQARWNADESRLLTAGTDETARLWDANTGRELLNLSGHGSDVVQAIWNADESRILTASLDGTAHLWDARTGEELLVFPGYTPSWSLDESRILTTSSQKTAQVWDAKTGQELLTLSDSSIDIQQAVWNADRSQILTANAGGTVSVWDDRSGIEPLTFYGFTNIVYQATWNNKEDRILAAGQDGVARVWNVRSGKELLRITGHTDRVIFALWNADESRILTASDDGDAGVWDANSGKELVNLSGHKDRVVQAVWNADESRILTADYDGVVRVCDARTGAELLSISSHKAQVWHALWNSDESRILTVGCDVMSGDICAEGTARVWDASTGQELFALEDDLYVVWDARWSRDGTQILLGGCNEWYEDVIGGCVGGAAQVWNAQTGKETLALPGLDGWVTAFWNHDESQILTISDNGFNYSVVEVWDANTGEKQLALIGYSEALTKAEWNADESRILTVSRDNTVRIWDAKTGEELLILPGNQAFWNVDGSRLVAADADGTVHLWNANTGAEQSVLAAHTDQVWKAHWSKDNGRLLTTSADGTVRLWHIRTEDLLQLACQLATRNMSREEWKQYIGDVLPYQAVCPNLPIGPEIKITPTP